mgnify:CR=1 FL=1
MSSQTELEAQLQTEISRFERIEALHALSLELRHRDRERAFTLVQEAQRLIGNDKTHMVKQRAKNAYIFARLYQADNKLEQALTKLFESIEICKQHELSSEYGDALFTGGLIYEKLNELPNALEYYVKALEYARKEQKIEDMLKLMNNVSILYTMLKAHEESEHYLQEAFELASSHHFVDYIPGTLLNYSFLYESQSDYPKMLEAATKALAFAEKKADKGDLLKAHGNLGYAHMCLNEYALARPHLEKSLEISREVKDDESEAVALQDLAEFFLLIEQDDEALPLYEEALEISKRLNIYRFIHPIHERLSQIYKRKGAFERALEHYEQFHLFKELLFNENSDTQLRNLQVLHKTQQALAEVEFQKQAREAELKALVKIASVAGEAFELKDTLEHLMELVVESLEGEKAVLYLPEFTQQQSVCLLWKEDETSEWLSLQELPRELREEVIKVEESEKEDVFEPGEFEREHGFEERRLWYMLPLHLKSEKVGVLGICWPSLPKVARRELFFSLARHVGIVVECVQLRSFAESTAIIGERQRLARDLHDSVNQLLYAITLIVEIIRRELSPEIAEGVRKQLSRLEYSSQQALKEMRLLIYELRPLMLEHGGLEKALQNRLDAVERRAGIDVALDAKVTRSLPPKVEEELFRIAQEALNNILKHAVAYKVEVSLHTDLNETVLVVKDNGLGFDVKEGYASGGMGLSNIQTRTSRIGGTLVLESELGEGVLLQVTVPYHQ